MDIRVKNNSLWLRLAWMLVFVTGILPITAQEDFNPTNPPEPELKHRVSVRVSPEEAGYPYGSGYYTSGSSVWLGSSNVYGFEFKHWLKDGVVCDNPNGFHYTVETADVEFVAVYEYTPESPDEPMLEEQFPLWLKCEPAEACSFNRTSGARVIRDEYVTVTAYANQGFVFQGWYSGDGTKVTDYQEFNYQMPNAETTLTARFVFNPASPGEPDGGGQDDVDTNKKGDVDGDGTVDVSDAVGIINFFLSAVADSAYDVNGDGTVDVSDAVEVINLYLKAQ